MAETERQIDRAQNKLPYNTTKTTAQNGNLRIYKQNLWTFWQKINSSNPPEGTRDFGHNRDGWEHNRHPDRRTNQRIQIYRTESDFSAKTKHHTQDTIKHFLQTKQSYMIDRPPERRMDFNWTTISDRYQVANKYDLHLETHETTARMDRKKKKTYKGKTCSERI